MSILSPGLKKPGIFNSLKIGDSLHTRKYRPDIDGLRAVAVISVVIFHAFPDWLPGGFVGVDIFFVISGYLITSILIKDINNHSFSILGFYKRRIQRIFPALIVVLLFVILVGWFCLFTGEFVSLGHHVVASTLFSENFLLWSESSYFDVAAEFKPTLHFWSLAIEEQFYIFWPVLLYFAYQKRFILALMFLLFGLSLAINVYDVGSYPSAAYYSPFGRFWELMLGSGLAYIQTNRPSLLSQYKNVQSFLGLFLILAALVLIDAKNRFPGFWALLPTLGSLFLISSGENGWVNRHLLSIAPMVWCGLLSYELYLWHWPLLSFGHIIYGGLWDRKTVELIVAAVVASVFTFFFIERPLRKRGGGARRARWLLAAMLVPLGGGVLLMTSAITPRLSSFDAATHTEWDFLFNRKSDSKKDTSMVYALEADRPHLVLFIGDSHIAQYASRLDKVITADPKRPGAILAIGGGCIPIGGAKTDNVRRDRCWPLRRRAYEMALENRFQRIVIGAAWNWYFLTSDYTYEVNGHKVPLTSSRGRQAAMSWLRKRIERLEKAGKDVVFLLDNPHDSRFKLGFNGIRLSLSAKNFKPNRTVRISDKELKLRDQLRVMAERAGATVIDPFSALCHNDVCRITSPTGQPIYKDSGHLNPDWAVGHADFIDAAVAEIYNPGR
jgi:peptidoglycan/LPS O-acetylase OafA/YrhL